MRALAALALAVGVARAEAPSPLWDDVVHPNRLRCAALVETARHHLESRAVADHAAALAPLVAATQLCPDRAEAFSLLGQARVDAGDLEHARAPLERARRLEDEAAGACADRVGCGSPDPRLAFHLGFVRVLAGDLEGSLAEYRRAEQAGGLGPNEEWLLCYDLGDDLMAMGRLTEAIDAYRRAVRARPVEVMPRLALAVALDRDEQLEKSRLELAEAQKIDPRLSDLASSRYTFVPAADRLYYVAVTERARKRFSEARRAVQAFLTAIPDSPYAPRARQLLATLPP